MEYKQIKPRKINEEVAEALLEMIKNGELKPGDKLNSVQQLAESFNVGRSAVREALSALRAMGLVEMKQGEGTYIREFDPMMLTLPLSTAVLMNETDIVHLLEVRKILEVGAAGSAAINRKEEDLKIMSELIEVMREGLSDEELGEKADLKFHLAIADATHNPILKGLMSNVSGMMVESMRETRRLWLFSKQATTERLYQDHSRIYQAIKDQDAIQAQKLIIEHLENVENVLKKYYQDKKGSS
ncbi:MULTISPECIES: FadR/GntR family transcriptional regulator [Bacillaceae]|uniref:FadR/GntR family transcriptional regulator n=1 Tax=Bacillaceae TaxID=186817 RepID=UPI000BFE76A7|nr:MULTISPECIES: FadR/GntR family transcriptional regulator [Bacillaceae]PGT88600.1 GntR family transcriptional regulator [Bacillus sp. AFS040349]